MEVIFLLLFNRLLGASFACKFGGRRQASLGDVFANVNIHCKGFLERGEEKLENHRACKLPCNSSTFPQIMSMLLFL